MRNLLIFLMLSLPQFVFAVQYSASVCQRVGLRDIPQFEGGYKINIVAPTDTEFVFYKEVAMVLAKTGTGTYSYILPESKATVFTCEFNGRQLMEMKTSYQPAASPNQPVEGYTIYAIENLQGRLRIQQLIFNPKKLSSQSVANQIVDKVSCGSSGGRLLAQQKLNCDKPFKSKILTFDNSKWDASTQIDTADMSSTVLNYYK